MEISKFVKESNGGYMFVNHKRAEEKGYADANDIICDINFDDKDKDYYITIGNDIIEFSSFEEMLEYKLDSGLKIRELIEKEKELLYYHIREVVDTGMTYEDKGSVIKAKPGSKVKTTISNEEWKKKYGNSSLVK